MTKITTWDQEDFGIEIVVEGTTTTATISIGGFWATGRSKLNPLDHYDEELGEKLATVRAAKKLFSKIEKLLVGSALTKEQYKQKQTIRKKLYRMIENERFLVGV